MTYTVGPCRAGELCRVFHPTTGPEDAEGHSLGPACLRAGGFAVQSLPADYRDLEQLIPRSLGEWSDGQPRGHSVPAPINLHVEALQRSIWWVVTAWEEVVRDQDRLSDPPSRVRPGPAVVRACAVLAPRVGMVSDLRPVELQDYPPATEEESHRFKIITHVSRWGWQGVLDLIRLHQRARSVLGLTAPVRRLPGVCGGCGRDSLRQDQPRYQGDEQPVYCHNCALTMSYDEYSRSVGMWAA